MATTEDHKIPIKDRNAYKNKSPVSISRKTLYKKIKMPKTDKQLKKAIQKAQKNYNTDVTHDSHIKKEITDQKKIIDTANDYLNKTNGYRAANDAYNQATKNVATLEEKLKKAKKNKKKDIEKSLKSAKKDQKSAFKDMDKIKKSASGQKQFDALAKAEKKLAALRKSKTASKTAKDNAKKKLDKLKKQKAARDKKAKAAKAKKNKASINKKIKDQSKKFLAPQTALYRADYSSSQVFFLGEISPDESDSADTPSYPVDSADPRTNYSRRSSKTLSGTYWLVSEKKAKTANQRWANLDKQFETLQKWQRFGYEVAIRGFSRWKHVYISSIDKVGQNQDLTGMQLSISFTYAMKANVVMRQKKSKTKSKGKAKTASGSTRKSNPKTPKVHVVKSGDTLWDISRKYKVSLSTLIKNNGGKSLIKPGQKVKL